MFCCCELLFLFFFFFFFSSRRRHTRSLCDWSSDVCSSDLDRTVITLYDADRCPYCARVRIVLAEKGIEYETVEIDLDDRPAWIYEKNPLGKRSEEHTSELQSHSDLVCRLLLEKKKRSRPQSP